MVARAHSGFPLVLRTTSNQTADGSLFRVFATNEHARAFGTDRFVVGMFMVDGEDLSGPVYGSLIVLRDDEGASENEPRIEKGCPCCPFAGRGSKSWVSISEYPSALSFASNSISFILVSICLQPQLYAAGCMVAFAFESKAPSTSHGASVRLSAAID